MGQKQNPYAGLPEVAAEYIRRVIRKMGYSRSARLEVRRELVDHFDDALRSCRDDGERAARAVELIAEFGEPRLLAVLIRRGKKRCRPAWKTAIVRSFQAVGVLLLCMILYVAWFFTGRPTITTDYVAQLNELAHPKVPDSENAWPHYQRAIELFVKPSKADDEFLRDLLSGRLRRFADLTQEQQANLRHLVTANEGAWKEFVAGSARPCCWRLYEAKDNSILAVSVPNLSSLGTLSRIGIVRALLEGQSRQWNEAVSDCMAVARSRNMSHSPVLIEYIVFLAMQRQASWGLAELADLPNVDTAALARAQREFEQVLADGIPVADLEGEHLMWLDMVQRSFTSDGAGGGHVMPKELRRLIPTMVYSNGNKQGKTDSLAFLGAALLHAPREQTLYVVEHYYDLMKDTFASPARQIPAKAAILKKYCEDLSPWRFALPRALLPEFSRLASMRFEAINECEATIAILALRRYRLEKGHYPDSLEQLKAEGYLSKLPFDYFAEGPLKYCKVGDDFLLYGVGWNMKDDGGVHDEKEEPWRGRNEGDAVYWPLAKPAEASSQPN
ncbi:MAG: hypothetical protein WC869_07365 [Phycisphaerae bacterium]|jgi:hypothetical protein